MRDGGVKMNETEQRKDARQASNTRPSAPSGAGMGLRMASCVQPITPYINPAVKMYSTKPPVLTPPAGFSP